MPCGANERAQLGNGNKENIYRLTEQKQFENCKEIETNGLGTVFIDNGDKLYCCGQWYNNVETVTQFIQPRKVGDNIKEAQVGWQQDTIYAIKKDGQILKYMWFNEVEINNVNGTEATFIYGEYVLCDGKLYEIKKGATATTASLMYDELNEIKKIKNETYLYKNYNETLVFSTNEKIYIQSKPNITKIGEKSNLELRKLYEDIIFFNGNGENINIVNRKGKLYEGLNSPSVKNNVKKVVASNSQKFIITEDKHIYAKGNGRGTMWGEIEDRKDYTELTNEKGEAFDNVKNIFTTSDTVTVIFQTEDNELYFGGNVNYITLPRNKRRNRITRWNFHNKISSKS